MIFPKIDSFFGEGMKCGTFNFMADRRASGRVGGPAERRACGD